jgi:hypothetical protein
MIVLQQVKWILVKHVLSNAEIKEKKTKPANHAEMKITYQKQFLYSVKLFQKELRSKSVPIFHTALLKQMTVVA